MYEKTDKPCELYPHCDKCEFNDVCEFSISPSTTQTNESDIISLHKWDDSPI